jgi:hypothetical protein
MSAGSRVASGVAVLGALLALRFLPARAATVAPPHEVAAGVVPGVAALPAP